MKLFALLLALILTNIADAQIPPLPPDRVPNAEDLNTDCPDDQIVKAQSGKMSCAVDQGALAGSPVILDLGDDDVNESIDISEVSVVNDADGVFSEPSPNELQVDVGKLLTETELDTEAELEAQLGDVTDVFTNNDTIGAANLDAAVLLESEIDTEAKLEALLGDVTNVFTNNDASAFIVGTDLDSEAELESQLGDVTNVFTNNDTIPTGNLDGAVLLAGELDSESELESLLADVGNVYTDNDTIPASDGGTGIDASAATGTVRVDSGTFSVGDILFVVASGLTASTTQTQGEGPLTASINQVSTVANDNDVRTLPTAVGGRKVTVVHDGEKVLQIFPASGDNLGHGLNQPMTIAAGKEVVFTAYDATNWSYQETPQKNCNPSEGPVWVTCDPRVMTDGTDSANTTAGLHSIINTYDSVVFPPGLYTVDCINKSGSDCPDPATHAADSGLRLIDGKHVHLMSGAIIQSEILANDQGQWYAFRLLGTGSRLTGDAGAVIDGRRGSQPTDACQAGVVIGQPRIETTNKALRVSVEGAFVIKSMSGRTAGTCGDGIIVQGKTGEPDNVQDGAIRGLTIDDNFRQAISITSGVRRFYVERNTLRGTTGTNPGCGVDIEPNTNSRTEQIYVRYNTIEDNAGCAVAVQAGSDTSQVSAVDISGNFIRDTAAGAGVVLKGQGLEAVRFHHNLVTSNNGNMVQVRGLTTDDGPVLIDRNTFFIENGTPGSADTCISIEGLLNDFKTRNIRIEYNAFLECPVFAIELQQTNPNFLGDLLNVGINYNYFYNNAGPGTSVIEIRQTTTDQNETENLDMIGNFFHDDRGDSLDSDFAILATPSVAATERATWNVHGNRFEGSWAIPYSGIFPRVADRGSSTGNYYTQAMTGNENVSPYCEDAGGTCFLELSCSVSNCNATLTTTRAFKGQRLVVTNIGASNTVTLIEAGSQELDRGISQVLNEFDSAPLIFNGTKWVQTAPMSMGNGPGNVHTQVMTGDENVAPSCKNKRGVCFVELSCTVTDCDATLTTGSAFKGQNIIVVNVGASNTVTLIDAGANQELNGGADQVLDQHDAVPLIYTGTVWVQVAPMSSN